MTRKYTVSKTVRFRPESFELVKDAAFNADVSTSEFIRVAALDAIVYEEEL